MKWLRVAVVVMALILAGWLVFDGSHGLVTGDYVTPKTGRHVGELGPWSAVVAAVGIDPRSNLMMSVHVLVGAAGLIAIAGFLMKVAWSWWAMAGFAVASLWYLPFGTLLGVAQLGLLTLTPLSRVRSTRSWG